MGDTRRWVILDAGSTCPGSTYKDSWPGRILDMRLYCIVCVSNAYLFGRIVHWDRTPYPNTWTARGCPCRCAMGDRTIGVLVADEHGRPCTSWQKPTALLYIVYRAPRRGLWLVQELTAAAWVELTAAAWVELNAQRQREEAERDATALNIEDEIHNLMDPPVPHG